MPPYDSIVRPLLVAEMLLCLPILLLGIAIRRQRGTESKPVLPVDPVLAQRMKVGALRWAQGFCLGMTVALAGTVFFIIHERSKLSTTRSTHLQVTAAEHSTPR